MKKFCQEDLKSQLNQGIQPYHKPNLVLNLLVLLNRPKLKKNQSL